MSLSGTCSSKDLKMPSGAPVQAASGLAALIVASVMWCRHDMTGQLRGSHLTCAGLLLSQPSCKMLVVLKCGRGVESLRVNSACKRVVNDRWRGFLWYEHIKFIWVWNRESRGERSNHLADMSIEAEQAGGCGVWGEGGRGSLLAFNPIRLGIN